MDGKHVAIKRISASKLNNQPKVFCSKEIAILCNLDHPGIVKFLCFYHENDFVSNKNIILSSGVPSFNY